MFASVHRSLEHLCTHTQSPLYRSACFFFTWRHPTTTISPVWFVRVKYWDVLTLWAWARTRARLTPKSSDKCEHKQTKRWHGLQEVWKQLLVGMHEPSPNKELGCCVYLTLTFKPKIHGWHKVNIKVGSQCWPGRWPAIVLKWTPWTCSAPVQRRSELLQT